MKRNKQSTRTMRHKSTVHNMGNKSRFAIKAASGKQMYGPGCCAHSRVRNYNEKFVVLLRQWLAYIIKRAK